MEEIAGATGDLPVDDTFHAAQVVVHTHIHDAQVETVLAAEHVHTATASGEVDHLLPSHFAWRHAHTLTLYTVVAAQQQVAGMIEVRR